MKNKMKQLFGIILSLVLVLGLMPTMKMKVEAADVYSIQYTSEMVFDCSRSPAYPKSGQETKVYNLGTPFKSGNQNGVQTELGTTYLKVESMGVYKDQTDALKHDLDDGLYGVSDKDNVPITKLVQYDSSGTKMGDFSAPGFLYILDLSEGSFLFCGSEYQTNNSYCFFLPGSAITNTSGWNKTFSSDKVKGLAMDASDLSVVTTYSVTIHAGEHMTKTSASGAVAQTGLTGAMTSVVYTADDGYYFPESYAVAAVSGISVTRDSDSQITVSGTPTADVEISLTAPTKKTEEPSIEEPTDTLPANLIDNENGTYTVTDENLGEAIINGAVVSQGEVCRMYNPSTGEHFYTKDLNERDTLVTLGWNYEEDASFATISATKKGAKEVYRVYNPNSGLHHFTLDKNEALTLKELGWAYEGVSFYAYDKDSSEGSAVYRLYNPNDGQHHWTTNSAERDYLVTLGWNNEEISWRVD